MCHPILLFIFIFPAVAVSVPGSYDMSMGIEPNPFTPRASLNRYWANHITSPLPIPPFLLSKASPLTAVDEDTFSKLASRGSLSSHFRTFCAAAKFICFPDPRVDRTLVDAFTSHAKNSATANVNSMNNGKALNHGVEFKGYDDDDRESKVAGFTHRGVEPGTFFRESALQEGKLLPMPDIRDKLPRRSFLPRTILSKLPFSTAKMTEMKQIFHADDNSSLARIMTDTLSECERTPSPGETKQCVGSIEDMVDFATSVLGRNIVVRTTEHVEGSGRQVMIGKVKGIDGGKVMESVSCHQSLFPYLLYYCHSVPKVRVYEADILDPESKSRINHGVAICHVDTTAWSAAHEAFLALGSGPGRIEVCHWVFQNDMTWTVSG